jgi:hypothetical protein
MVVSGPSPKRVSPTRSGPGPSEPARLTESTLHFELSQGLPSTREAEVSAERIAECSVPDGLKSKVRDRD